MPKLNTQNPQVREYLLKVARYWIEEADIDGWRLDVADEVDHDFWRDFRKTVKAAKKDAYILGELWLNALPWLMGDQFDAVMNYPFTRNCLQYFIQQKISTKQLRESITKIQMDHMQQVNEVMFNLLDSHDTARFLTLAQGDKNALKLAAAFQFTYTGAPCIYYGTEIGMEGAGDPDCRRTMEWNEDKWDRELYNYYKHLISIRKQYDVLRVGTFSWIDCDDNILAYVRETDQEKVFVYINNYENDSTQTIEVGCDTVIDVFTNEKICTKTGKFTFDIEKKSVRIFACT
jgi:glycosidase